MFKGSQCNACWEAARNEQPFGTTTTLLDFEDWAKLNPDGTATLFEGTKAIGTDEYTGVKLKVRSIEEIEIDPDCEDEIDEEENSDE
jgi:hypothetical protein